jgi:DNA polymerase-3 subunit gamma/tau
LTYQALYRVWRPRTFEDVVGQEHITAILKNQISAGRVSHAYLFCGARGTGKTSTAKIFARAVNCEELIGGEPCLKCGSCLDSLDESSVDIIEIDAASNNGVDEIRDIREKAGFAPVGSKYKVYIIDEVHMLSSGAFNALLKTLEEPPAHVIFILATTEPQKLPATVLSRCQRYDFRRITVKDMLKRLQTIADGMDIKADPRALEAMARAAEGGMRDAISLLDQSIAFLGEDISYDGVLDMLGAAEQEFYFDVAADIISGDAGGALIKLDRHIENGGDIAVFTKDFSAHLRALIVSKHCEKPEEILEITEEKGALYKEQAKEASQERLLRAIRLLNEAEYAMRLSSQPRIVLEAALVTCCRPAVEDGLDAVLDRLDALEKALKNGAPAAISAATASVPDADADTPPWQESQAIKPKKAERVEPERYIEPEQDIMPAATQEAEVLSHKAPDLSSSKEVWEKVLKHMMHKELGLYTSLRLAKADIKDGQCTLKFRQANKSMMQAAQRQSAKIEDALNQVTGQKISVETRFEDEKQDIADVAISLFGEENVIIED